MKVLVVGSGGREHALAWKLLQSDRIQEVICVPGNGGTATLQRCRNLGLMMTDFEGIARFATVNNIGLIVVGPEAPLAEGITDYLQAQNLTVFGPNQAGAQIEASKAWAKALMKEAKVPTAAAQVFTAAAPAIAYVNKTSAPIVIKADGLAAGKGVTVAATVEEAVGAIEAAFGGQFGAAGQQIVIEECLVGQEASVLAITDGKTIRPLLPAQDHKRIGEGDTGANTGGMGAYAPAPIVTPELMDRIQQEILQPTLEALQKRGIDYRGVLYAGLMISPEGDPKVIEFNCRFGDPETQVVLPLLDMPLHEVLLACAQQRLDQLPPLQWLPGAAACVVVAAQGYPDRYTKGIPIFGLQTAEAKEVMVFHAGTRVKEQQLISDGGRVLNVCAIGDSLLDALNKVYASLEVIQFDGMYYRRDIGHHALAQVERP